MDKINNDTRVYTDVNALEQLRGQLRSNPEKAKHEVAQQFESIFIQMMLRSMRDANKGFTSDLLSSHDMEMYEDMFDKQLSLSLSQKGLGLRKSIEDSIDRINHPTSIEPSDTRKPPFYFMGAKIIPANMETMKPQVTNPINQAPPGFESSKDFVEQLWGYAKSAANKIGTQTEALLAQAGLETDWGKKIIRGPNGSTFNLFNIKSDSKNDHDSVKVSTIEHRDGLIKRENAQFKSYNSYQESFIDYVKLIKNNPRYADARSKAANPEDYFDALQAAGYATDENYAKKIKGIYNSHHFNHLILSQK